MMVALCICFKSRSSSEFTPYTSWLEQHDGVTLDGHI